MILGIEATGKEIEKRLEEDPRAWSRSETTIERSLRRLCDAAWHESCYLGDGVYAVWADDPGALAEVLRREGAAGEEEPYRTESGLRLARGAGRLRSPAARLQKLVRRVAFWA